MGLFRNKKQEEPLRQPRLMQGQGENYLFRRSRTIVGSVSSRVRAAAEPAAQLQSPRLKVHRLRQHRRGVGALLATSVAGVIGISWLLSQFIQIPSEARYAQALSGMPSSSKHLAAVQRYFALNPTERFLFNLNEEALSRFVNEAYPEVGKVAIEKKGLTAFDLAITLRQPVAVWRGGGREMFVDREGEIFFNNYFALPLVTVEDQSGISPEDIETVASERFISFMGRLVDTVNDQNIGNVQTVIIPKGTTRQIDIKLEGRDYIIKTHIDRTPASQAADIAAAVKYVESKKITPQYLDARIAGKAYYR